MECKKCNKQFSSKQALNYHEKRKVCEKVHLTVFECSCGKVFSTNQRLQYHKQKKVCIKPSLCLKCEKCDKEFSTKQKLQYHIENNVCEKDEDAASYYHVSGVKGMRCSYCEIDFKDEAERWYHFRECRDQCRCGNKKWHMKRCRGGTLDRMLRKREIDTYFGLDPPFDKGLPDFNDWKYWDSYCKLNHKRSSDAHIMNCIKAGNA